MLKRYRWVVLSSAGLLALTAALYTLHIIIFRDARNTFFYLFQDLAFLPLQVLLVTLIINSLLTVREKRAMLKKMNMVIGAFFSEVGTRLLKMLAEFDLEPGGVAGHIGGIGDWPEIKFQSTGKRLKAMEYTVDSRKGNLEELRSFLLGRRNFLLRLLENPNLLEHDSFTDLLWAVFHLTDELAHRADVKALPQADLEHLSGDIRRAYSLLLVEWLAYLGHLKRDYPYLHSLAVRTNPFDGRASVVIGERI